MSRFEKLELPANEHSTKPSPCRPSDFLDESHWLRAADRERRTGNFENALRNYSRALERNRSNVVAWSGQVRMLVLLEECPEAELWSRKALELFPQHGDLLAGQAQAVCRTGDLRRAADLSDGSLSCAKESAFRWIVRGEVLLAAGRTAAGHCFQKALSVETDWLVPLEIALIHRHYALPSRAMTFARHALQTAGNEPYPWCVLGLCQSDMEMNAAALRSFERCLDVSPGHLEAQRSIARLSRRPFSLFRWWRRCW